MQPEPVSVGIGDRVAKVQDEVLAEDINIDPVSVKRPSVQPSNLPFQARAALRSVNLATR